MKLSFRSILKGSVIVFLLFFVFMTQMLYSGGLEQCIVWLERLYWEYTEEPSPSITTLMTPKIIEKNKASIRNSVAGDAIFIEGGEFTMGPDNCKNYAPAISECAGAPVYRVKLSSFSMLKFKITNRDFDTFQADMGQYINPFRGGYNHEKWEKIHQHSDLPTILNWKMADQYCQWLGKLTNLPIALPTEAQWEYAARNRGQYLGFMTNNNKIEPGINVPSYKMIRDIKDGYLTPVGQFPPSPLGLYDLSGNGLEWVNDWYSRDRPVGKEPFIDPKGPTKGYLTDQGPAKVLRPYQSSESRYGFGMTVHDRYFAAESTFLDTASPYTARCVINLPQRITTNE